MNAEKTEKRLPINRLWKYGCVLRLVSDTAAPRSQVGYAESLAFRRITGTQTAFITCFYAGIITEITL
jgi:hypothetical protein